MEQPCVHCGATVAYPDDRSEWDVTTEVQGGFEVVVERHVARQCPDCGEMGHSHLPYGVDDAAYANRALALIPQRTVDPRVIDPLPLITHPTGPDSDGRYPEVANIVRELVGPPETFTP